MFKTIAIPTTLACALALAGCASLGGFGGPAQSPLAYAPANTAFVFGNLNAAPKEYADFNQRWYAQLNTGVVKSLERFQTISAEMITNPDSRKRSNALAKVLAQKLSQAEGWQAIGLDINARLALYEVNGLPVLRMELSDPKRFEAFIAEAEQTAGLPFERADVDGQAFWHSASMADADSAITPRSVMAIVGKHLVLTVDVQRPDTALAAQLGVKKPEQSVIDTKAIETLNTQYGFQPGAASGYIDLQRVFNLATSQSQTQPWVASLLRDSDKPLSAACQSELGAVVAQAPRIAFGATELIKPDYKVNIVWELQPELAQDWRSLPAPVQGLDSASRGNVVFGTGLNLSATAAFLQKRAAAIAAKPYECELLQPLNELAAEANEGIAALYAASSWVQGLRLNFSNLNIKEQDVTGTLLLASPNPMGLVGMAQSFSPELAKLGLTIGGGAKPLDLSESPMIAGLNERVWAIVGEYSLGLGKGPNAKNELEQAIATTTPAVPPLLYFGSTGDAMADLLGSFSEEDFAEQATGQWEKWYNYLSWPISDAYLELYKDTDYMDLQWLATERGLEFPQTMVFKPAKAQ